MTKGQRNGKEAYFGALSRTLGRVIVPFPAKKVPGCSEWGPSSAAVGAGSDLTQKVITFFSPYSLLHFIRYFNVTVLSASLLKTSLVMEISADMNVFAGYLNPDFPTAEPHRPPSWFRHSCSLIQRSFQNGCCVHLSLYLSISMRKMRL